MKLFLAFVGIFPVFYLSFVHSYPKEPDKLTQCEPVFLDKAGQQELKITSLLTQIRETSQYTTLNLLEKESSETLRLLNRRLFSEKGIEWEKAKRNVLYAFREMRPEDPELRQILSNVISSKSATVHIKIEAVLTLRKMLKPDDTKIYEDLIDVFLSNRTPHQLKQVIAVTFGEGKPRNPGIRRILLDILYFGKEESWINRVLTVSIEKITEAYPDIYQDSANVIVLKRETNPPDIRIEFLKVEEKLKELEKLENIHTTQVSNSRRIAKRLHAEYRNERHAGGYPFGSKEYRAVRSMEIEFNEAKEQIQITERRIQNLMAEIQNFHNRVLEFKDREEQLP